MEKVEKLTNVFVVLDPTENYDVMYCAYSPKACHDHIKYVIDNEEIGGENWIIREYAPVIEIKKTGNLELLKIFSVAAMQSIISCYRDEVGLGLTKQRVESIVDDSFVIAKAMTEEFKKYE